MSYKQLNILLKQDNMSFKQLNILLKQDNMSFKQLYMSSKQLICLSFIGGFKMAESSPKVNPTEA